MPGDSKQVRSATAGSLPASAAEVSAPRKEGCPQPSSVDAGGERPPGDRSAWSALRDRARPQCVRHRRTRWHLCERTSWRCPVLLRVRQLESTRRPIVQTYEALHRRRPGAPDRNGARGSSGTPTGAGRGEDSLPTLYFIDQARRVAQLLDAGHSNRQIAERLGVSGARVSQIRRRLPALAAYLGSPEPTERLRCHRDQLWKLRRQALELAAVIRRDLRALSEELDASDVDRILGLR